MGKIKNKAIIYICVIKPKNVEIKEMEYLGVEDVAEDLKNVYKSVCHIQFLKKIKNIKKYETKNKI